MGELARNPLLGVFVICFIGACGALCAVATAWILSVILDNAPRWYHERKKAKRHRQ